MRISVDRTTRFRLALIGIPLLECLILLCIMLLILFGGRLFSCNASGSREVEAQDARTLVETVVEIKAKSASEEWMRVSLSRSGVLLYTPTQRAQATVAELKRDNARNIYRPDIAALMDFGNGTLPILQRNQDAITLAKLLYGEARGINSEAEKAAIVWCVLNRVDDPRFPDTVDAVVTQRSQFSGYSASHPVQSNLYLLSLDVLNRWEQGKRSGTAAGRVLPAEYCYFMGDGRHNYFAEDLGFLSIWDWSYPDPYPAIRKERLQNYFPNEREIQMVANVVWGVSQGDNIAERKAVVWCVLNRVASSLFPDTVYEVITEKKQFPAYRATNLILDENVAIVREVVGQWYMERNGAAEDEVDRLLPANYLYFDGNGWRNYFSKTYPVRYGYVFIADRGYLKARW